MRRCVPTSFSPAWGIANQADKYPEHLSGGQQQRVGVARGLAVDPNILLMDEPFGAVDPLVRSDLQEELIRLQRDLDKTVVFVTHNLEEALALGQRVVALRGGEVALDAPARELNVAKLRGTLEG